MSLSHALFLRYMHVKFLIVVFSALYFPYLVFQPRSINKIVASLISKYAMNCLAVEEEEELFFNICFVGRFYMYNIHTCIIQFVW